MVCCRAVTWKYYLGKSYEISTCIVWCEKLRSNLEEDVQRTHCKLFGIHPKDY